MSCRSCPACPSAGSARGSARRCAHRPSAPPRRQLAHHRPRRQQVQVDPRSASLNTEINLAIDSPELAFGLLRLGQTTLETGAFRLPLTPHREHIEWVGRGADGKETVHTDEPDNNGVHRLKMGLLLAFVSEMQL